jgi:N-acetylglucosaminyldiphosphoundecaprenol N-acetyl-beta-D-mannosaminyltransferase
LAAVEPNNSNARALVQRQYFGTTVHPCTFAQWLHKIATVLASGERRWLCGHHNLHSLYQLHYDRDVRHFYQRCNDCYIDGAPIRLLLGCFGGGSAAQQRFSLMNDFTALLDHAEQEGWSVFYLGSTESVVETARLLVREQFPRLRIQFRNGYSSDEPGLSDAINAWQTDILLVGMGMPQQERWINQHIEQLDVGLITQAGATLDYYAGAQAQPPAWLGQYGLAWLYRLLHDPRRLWRRYLLEPWGLIAPTLQYWRQYRRARLRQ